MGLGLGFGIERYTESYHRKKERGPDPSTLILTLIRLTLTLIRLT